MKCWWTNNSSTFTDWLSQLVFDYNIYSLIKILTFILLMQEHIFLFLAILKSTVRTQKHLSNWFVLISGIWNVIFSVITLPVLSNRVLTSPFSMSTFTVSMLISSSLITVSAVWFRLSSVAITQESSQWNDMRLI